MKTATLVTAVSAVAVSAELYPGQSKDNHTCLLVPDYQSCSPQANPLTVDSCCVETFGGLLVATQFWDVYTGLESEGQLLPATNWTNSRSLARLLLTIRNSNGSYTQYCDLSRQYDPVPSPNTTTGLPNGTVVPAYNGSGIGTFLEPFGRYDLLEYMNTYWIAQNSPNQDLWGHEFSKHATCFSAFDVPCYGPQYVEHEEVVDFFETTILYYSRLNTFAWLAEHDITPSNSTTYTLSDFEDALTTAYGATPYVGCSGTRYNETADGEGSLDNGRTQISEMWYHFHVNGRPQEGNSVPVDKVSTSSCAKVDGALHYYERASGSVRAAAPAEGNGTATGY